MKSKYHNYDASIHKIVNGKIVYKSVSELIEDQKRRDQAARELSAIGIKTAPFR
jgi:hypothetical protein